MRLKDAFRKVAAKSLASVDLPHHGSNQHEINGASSVREFFDTGATVRGRFKWIYFCDDADPERGNNGEFTFTDVRKRSAERTGRSEWRLYYSGEFLERASPGDVIVLARPSTNNDDDVPLVYGLVFQNDSNWLRAVEKLLNLNFDGRGGLTLVSDYALSAEQVDLLGQQLFDMLDAEDTLPPAQSDKELVAATFGSRFPTTREMSEFARLHSSADWREPDDALLRWVGREEQLFKALESVEIESKLPSISTVDDFLSYSLTVQNRRKSRMGHAFENHLTELFKLHGLRFDRQAKTEGKRKPDFLFPGAKEYHDPAFPTAQLRVLGAKSTLKERWRQVLDEAARIHSKHLCTLDSGASREQIDQIEGTGIHLVIPDAVRETYDTETRSRMMSVRGFILEIKSLQAL